MSVEMEQLTITKHGTSMATDINEVYKMYPCAKKAMEANIKYFNEPFDRRRTIL